MPYMHKLRLHSMSVKLCYHGIFYMGTEKTFREIMPPPAAVYIFI